MWIPKLRDDRLVMYIADDALYTFDTYRVEETGTPQSGTMKIFQCAPGSGGDLSIPIAEHGIWEIGRTLILGDFISDVDWFTGTFGYSGSMSATSDSTDNVSIEIKALDENEDPVATLWTCGCDGYASITNTWADLVLTECQGTIYKSITPGITGKYVGKLNGILIEITHDGSANCGGNPPVVGANSCTPYATTLVSMWI